MSTPAQQKCQHRRYAGQQAKPEIIVVGIEKGQQRVAAVSGCAGNSKQPQVRTCSTHGLYFCAYCARLYNIEQLLSMFGDTDGKRDALLRFTRPVTGGYYFAPSVERLLAL